MFTNFIFLLLVSMSLILTAQCVGFKNRPHAQTSKTHEEVRGATCGICFCKSRNVRPISESQLKQIRLEIYEDYNIENDIFPKGMCTTCRLALNNKREDVKTGKIPHTRHYLPPRFDYSQLYTSKITRNTPDCMCYICIRWRITISPKDCGPPQPKKKCVTLKCDKCESEIGRGLTHDCTKITQFNNIMDTLNSDGLLKQQVTAACIRTLTDGSGDAVLSNLHGKPTQVNINTNTSRKSNRFTKEDLIRIQATIKISDNVLLQLLTNIRVVFGRNSVEPKFKEYLTDLNSYLQPFFTTTSLTLEHRIYHEDKTSELVNVQRPVFYCLDVDAFVKFIIEYRAIDPYESLVKIGIDGGGGFLKVTLNIIQTTTSEEESVLGKRRRYSDGVRVNTGKDTGVKKSYILLIVPAISETYNNIKTLLDLLDLDSIHFIIASDLKLCNIILGLQSHSATHCCLYCEGSKPWLISACLRTLNSLKESYNAYVRDGSKLQHAAKYGNVVNSPLLSEDSNQPIYKIIPPMELHLYLGPINLLFAKIGLILGFDIFKDFLRSNNIVKSSYRGGEFEGPQCRKLLAKLDLLVTQSNNLEILPVIKALRCFKQVVKSCYSTDLLPSFKEDIDKFRAAYMELEIPITPKVHIIFDHVSQFCQEEGKGLGIFSEQASESIHADFSSYWSKYSVKEINNPFYLVALEKACISYNSKHVI